MSGYIRFKPTPPTLQLEKHQRRTKFLFTLSPNGNQLYYPCITRITRIVTNRNLTT